MWISAFHKSETGMCGFPQSYYRVIKMVIHTLFHGFVENGEMSINR